MPCTTILVGKNATNDGSTIISRNDDGAFEAKKVVVIERNKNGEKYKSKIAQLEIELPSESLRYTSIPSVNLHNGLWPAAGINEKNVSMTATETITSNPRVVGAAPYVRFTKAKNKKEKATPGGIGEEDLVTIILPYINRAREGVIRLGELLEKYGTYEANGIAFADEDEIWWVETIGGHHFIARRVEDDEVVIMPNQFGLDKFDFDDAYSKQEKNICSKDLKEFIINNHLDLNFDEFNPRYCFGSRMDSDHVYNTPRAWYLLRYFCPLRYKYDGLNPDFNPESDNIPWSFKPEKKVTVWDIKYLLSSHYQGTPYNPYGNDPLAGKYRSIGVPNSDDSQILQIRGNYPDKLKGLEWLSLGGSGFTCCFPFFTNVSKLPKYISGTTSKISLDNMYWASRIIAVFTDCHLHENTVFDERYQLQVFNKAEEILKKYEALMIKNDDYSLLERVNDEILKMVEEESNKVISTLLDSNSRLMKTRYHRKDN